jgi:capsular polysaccharide biosynthesis protein
MDLLSIARKFWRYKLLTIPVVLLTLLGAAYVVAVKEPVYQASASFVLLNPPAPPTAEEVARNPALGKVNAENPYTRFGDQSVVIQVLASTISSDSARRALAQAGADRRYTVAPHTEFGYSSPIVEITAMASSPAAAMASAKIVNDATIRELERMQESRGVDERYRIKALAIKVPDEAQLQASGKLRALVGVLALGGLLMFMVVSIIDAFATLRTERRSPIETAGTNGWHGDLSYGYEHSIRDLTDEPKPR